MNTLPASVLSLCLGAALAAQSSVTWTNDAPAHLRVAFPPTNELPAEPGWVSEGIYDGPHGALQIAAGAANTVTLLFAFVAPDPTFDGNLNTLATLRTIYPFIDHPETYWRASDVATQLVAPVTIENESTAVVVVPPQRVRAQLNAAMASGTLGAFGPAGPPPASGAYVRPASVAPGQWPSEPPKADERHAWSGTWNGVRDVFDMGIAGRRSLDVAAFSYTGQATTDGVANLQQMIEQTYQWLIQIQTVQATPPATSGGPWRLKFSEPVAVRRRSLAAQQNDPWLDAVGPERESPSILFLLEFFNMAGWGELLIVKLEKGMTDEVFAHVPVAGGGWSVLPRIYDFGGVDLVELRPDHAVFAYPPNGVAGTGYIALADLTLVHPLHPQYGTFGYGYAIYPFTPVSPVLP